MKHTSILLSHSRAALLLPLIAAFLFFSPEVSAAEPSLSDTVAPLKRGKVGLVLSGGGAKGIAHVGVIKALEDNDIPIDYVAGTSMGAIVGSLYSIGYSPEEMMKLFKSEGFKSWSTGKIDKKLTYFFDDPEPTPKWITLNVNPKDTSLFSSGILPTNLINPLPMNFEFMALFSPYTEQCAQDFNKLMVPFRCVASDVYHKRKVVFGSGNLGNSVRASMSFPLVFKPISIDGVLMYDGGIYDNFPVDVMHSEFNPDFMIGVAVSGPDGKPEPDNVYSQLEDLIIQNNDYNLPSNLGVKIAVPVLNFGVLDFDKADVIYEIGYKTGLEMVDSIKARTASRRALEEVTRRREAFKVMTPNVVFDSVSVSGNTTASQAEFLKFNFTRGRREPFTMERARESYYRCISSGKFANLLPEAVPGNDPHILSLKATTRNKWNFGVGGWVTSSTNSMLYLSAGYNTLSFNSMDFNLSAWIGQSYYAGMLSARFAVLTHRPSYIEVQGVLSRQKYYDSELLFYEAKTPTFIGENENYVRLNFGTAVGMRGKAVVSAGYGYQRDSYFPDQLTDYANAVKDRSTHNIWLLRAYYERNSLDNQMYPSEGASLRGDIFYAYDKSSFREGKEDAATVDLGAHSIGRAEILYKLFCPLHRKFSLGFMANGVATISRLYQNYTAHMIQAPAFAPTPSTKNYFNIGFRSDNYLAAGIIPIFKPFANMQVRGDFYAFAPVRHLVSRAGMAAYDGWFHRMEFIGELSAVYNFPFASLSFYANYLSSPAKNWNFGISFGLFFQAPRFMR